MFDSLFRSFPKFRIFRKVDLQDSDRPALLSRNLEHPGV
jgi:hypothetical protein